MSASPSGAAAAAAAAACAACVMAFCRIRRSPALGSPGIHA
ncbi:hypothetical protein ACFQU9_15820 [Actinomadura namibiensis]|uniref:Uncharacterized protein n=1 Tax=Actinomadura namibiensis TaxID=182080 RepID=A0A7W3LSH4_ACTNM|nr:hypothetical protein [Actinomadura namibiensis]MBA8953387.1 hypothetical protein [Actinomadura namibiensis]